MRILSVLLISVLSSSAFAAIIESSGKVTEVRGAKPGIYKFLVEEPEQDGGQASSYTSPNLAEVFQRAKQDIPALKKLIAEIYKENGCTTDGKAIGEDYFCGELNEVSEDNTVLWSYGRGGWASAGATRKSFLTFTTAGSGAFTEPVLEITTSVDVDSTSDPSAGAVVFEVTIDMTQFKRIK